MEPPHPRYRHYTWTPITIGCSGARVFRLDDPSGRPRLYAKSASRITHPDVAAELPHETVRLAWLAQQNIPVPDVVESTSEGDDAWLITTALPGRSAAEDMPPERSERQRAIVDAIADIACRLHALPIADCPFDRRLSIAIPEAEQRAASGGIDLDDLDEEREGWTAERLVQELHRTKPSREDIVVCHGDFCLPNVFLDDSGTTVTGLLDVGRLGLADRYADLALMSRSLASPLNESYDSESAARFFARYGADPADPRIAFYRLLDEFF